MKREQWVLYNINIDMDISIIKKDNMGYGVGIPCTREKIIIGVRGYSTPSDSYWLRSSVLIEPSIPDTVR